VKRFSADWLALREPHDARARNPAVLDALVVAVAGRAGLAIVDLASGAGATLRAISSRLPPRQRWTLVDHDPGLLERISSAPVPGVDVVTVLADLARDIEAALGEPVDLVTASALLDLVSADWLDRMSRTIAARGLSVYAALTYDGRITIEPADTFDAEIICAVNKHQRRDKGFGPALGPTAGAEAIARFAALDYAVVQGASDWVLREQDIEIQINLLAGWAEAASEVGNPDPIEINAWLQRRRARAASGRSSIRVGHIDFFARPTGRR
jgi:hypothetical protein